MNDALYFPYIDIPNDHSFIRSILYWDRVGSIVPQPYFDDERLHSPFMQEMIDANLVYRVSPLNYLDGEDSDSFIRSLGNLNINPYTRTNTLVHEEKMYELVGRLTELGLASPKGDQWYWVEETVANALMTFLAHRICDSQEGTVPVTFESSFFSRKTRRAGMNDVRNELLDITFPCPTRPVGLMEVLKFKEENSDSIGRFRGYIERITTEISGRENTEERSELVQTYKVEIAEEIDHYESQMRKCWRNLGFFSIVPIITAAASVMESNIWYLQAGTALTAALNFGQQLAFSPLASTPLAYGVLAQRTFRMAGRGNH